MSTKANPELAAVRAGFYTGMGHFWDRLFQDHDLISALGASSGHLSAQLCQLFSDTHAAFDRRNIPLYQRQRWAVTRLSKASRNKAPHLAVKAGGADPVRVGPQQLPHLVGSLPRAGGYVPRAGYTGYPLPDYDGGISAIVDSLEDPQHVLIAGVDFIFVDHTILFRDGVDPFALGFPRRHVGEDDEECLLTVRDAYVDRKYVQRFLGAALGIAGATSDWYRSYLNNLFDLARSGGSESAFLRYIHTALDVPVTSGEEEKVEYIGEVRHGVYGVITDKAVYNIPEGRQSVSVGDKLLPGTPLTDLVQVLDIHDAALSEHLVALPVGGSVAAPYGKVPVIYYGDDRHGLPRLRFELQGRQEDIESFWVWHERYAETAGVDVSGPDVLGKSLYDVRPEVPGAVWGEVSPARFFVDYYPRSSTKFIVVDRDTLSEYGRRGLYRLEEAYPYLPAGTRVHVVLPTAQEETHELDGPDEPQDYAMRHVRDTGPAAEDSVVATLVAVCGGRDND